MAAIPILERDAVVWGRLCMRDYESLSCETKGIMDSTAQSQIFTISIELLCIGSYEDDHAVESIEAFILCFLGQQHEPGMS